MLLDTAKQHFDEDELRAKALLGHAGAIPGGVLKDDILRSAWMMAVGACDAYFSDAYADLISRTLRAKELQAAIDIPDRLNNLRIPVTAVIREAHGGWRWRMAARELIEDENVLSLEKIRHLFGHFFRKKHKIISLDTIEKWILNYRSPQRLFGISPTNYRKLQRADKHKAKEAALEKFEFQFEQLFQRRHDCIHNCDRPLIALQNIDDLTVEKRIQDVVFLVESCHEAFQAEFPIYLKDLGFSGATRGQVLG